MAAPPGAIALSATHGGTSRAATQLVIGEDVAPDGVQQAADNADPGGRRWRYALCAGSPTAGGHLSATTSPSSALPILPI